MKQKYKTILFNFFNLIIKRILLFFLILFIFLVIIFFFKFIG